MVTHKCFNQEANQTKFQKKCYRVVTQKSQAKMVGLQLLSQPSTKLKEYMLGLKIKLAFFQKPDIQAPEL